MVEKKAPPIPQPMPMQSAPQGAASNVASVFDNVEKVTPVTTPAAPVEKPQEGPQYGLYDDNFAADLNLPAKLLRTKSMAVILGGTFLIGLIFGGSFFSGSTQQVVQGLSGVVGNPDIEPNTPRCGMVSAGQECILYLMNSSRQDRLAETFFDEAVRLTEVAKYSISMANPQYAKRLIKPGYIAQIKIPNVR